MDASHGTREQGILGMGICTDMGWESERSIAGTWASPVMEPLVLYPSSVRGTNA